MKHIHSSYLSCPMCQMRKILALNLVGSLGGSGELIYAKRLADAWHGKMIIQLGIVSILLLSRVY